MGKDRGKAPGAVRRIKGSISGRGRKIGIVVSEFNEYLTNALLDGALDALLRYGTRQKDITVVHVPGAFEIPLAARKLIRSARPDAVLTLSVVIKGQTKHFDQVVLETAKGVRELAKETGIPVILGMVPAASVAQAICRAGVKHTNKGREWAAAALAMADVCAKLERKGRA